MNELIKHKLNEETHRHRHPFKVANEHFLEEPWVEDVATERVERLQSNDALPSAGKRKQRNETLFIGKKN